MAEISFQTHHLSFKYIFKFVAAVSDKTHESGSAF